MATRSSISGFGHDFMAVAVRIYHDYRHCCGVFYFFSPCMLVLIVITLPDGNWKAAQQRCDHSPCCRACIPRLPSLLWSFLFFSPCMSVLIVITLPDGNWKAAQQRCDHSPCCRAYIPRLPSLLWSFLFFFSLYVGFDSHYSAGWQLESCAAALRS